MNRKINIAAAIEKNRIALLRLVFCWLAAAYCMNVRGDKPLPRRLAHYVAGLIGAAEKAAGYLLIAIYYRSQIKRCYAPDFEKAAANFVASNKNITLGALTLPGIIKRLKALQNTLHNLYKTTRQLAKNIAAHARVLALKIATQVSARSQKTPSSAFAALPEDAIPP